MKKRPSIPQSVRNAVLHEYNHRCAICGGVRPNIHHIDGNPTNNEPNNLMPLCPNHHLLDMHNPTMPIAQGKLVLFRNYKDPAILHTKFHPLYERLSFLEDIPDTITTTELAGRVSELVAFVNSLNMGAFYSRQLSQIFPSPPPGILVFYAREVSQEKANDIDSIYIGSVRAARQAAEKLVVEMLRYQDWLKEPEQ